MHLDRGNGTRGRARTAVLAAIVAATAAVLAASGAGAADLSTVQSNLSDARSEAESLAQTIEARSAELEQLQAEAQAAAVREQQLTALLGASLARSHQLAVELSAAEEELARAQARLKRAIEVLSSRLVEIYKGSDPDYLSVVLAADGYDDLITRAEYLDELQEADSELTERVRELRDDVADQVERIGELKAQEDANAERLADARVEVASIRAGAEQRAAATAAAQAAEAASLDQLRAQIDGWAAQVETLQAADDGYQEVAEWVGQYSIPYAIVVCESGGNYSAYNPDSGAGGAYQILPSTWRTYGGQGLPHQAPEAEQDRIARLIWEGSGPSAWVCAG
jgi:chromosome segregation ATPase